MQRKVDCDCPPPPPCAESTICEAVPRCDCESPFREPDYRDGRAPNGIILTRRAQPEGTVEFAPPPPPPPPAAEPSSNATLDLAKTVDVEPELIVHIERKPVQVLKKEEKYYLTLAVEEDEMERLEDEREALIAKAIEELKLHGNKLQLEKAVTDELAEHKVKAVNREVRRNHRDYYRKMAEIRKRELEIDAVMSARERKMQQRDRDLEAQEAALKRSEEALTKRNVAVAEQLKKKLAQQSGTYSHPPHPAPNPIRLANGAKNFENSYAEPQFNVIDGVCFVSGVASLPEDEQVVIATLPDKCRPSVRRVFDVELEGLRTARIDVLPTGEVRLATPAAGSQWVSFDGVSFSVAPSVRSAPVTLNGKWQPLGGEYGAPLSVQHGGTCALEGIVSVPSGNLADWNAQIGTVESNCAPADGTITFKVNQDAWPQRIDIETDGTIRWLSGNRTRAWLPLDGLVYPRYGRAPLDLLHGWTAYGRGYRLPSYSLQDTMCLVGGVLRGPANALEAGGIVTQLPQGCRPIDRIIFSTISSLGPARFDVLPDGRLRFMGTAALANSTHRGSGSGAKVKPSSFLELQSELLKKKKKKKKAPPSPQPGVTTLQWGLVQKQHEDRQKALARQQAAREAQRRKVEAAEKARAKEITAKANEKAAKARKKEAKEKAIRAKLLARLRKLEARQKNLRATLKQLRNRIATTTSLRQQALQVHNNAKAKAYASTLAALQKKVKSIRARMKKNAKQIRALRKRLGIVNKDLAKAREEQKKKEAQVAEQKAKNVKEQKVKAAEVLNKNKQSESERKKADEQFSKNVESTKVQENKSEGKAKAQAAAVEREATAKKEAEENGKRDEEQARKRIEEATQKKGDVEAARKAEAESKTTVQRLTKAEMETKTAAEVRRKAAEKERQLNAQENAEKKQKILEEHEKQRKQLQAEHVERVNQVMAAVNEAQKKQNDAIDNLKKEQAKAQEALKRAVAEKEKALNAAKEEATKAQARLASNKDAQEAAHLVYKPQYEKRAEEANKVVSAEELRVKDAEKKKQSMQSNIKELDRQLAQNEAKMKFFAQHQKVVEKVVKVEVPQPPPSLEERMLRDDKPADAITNPPTLPPKLPESWFSLEGIHFKVAN